MINTLPQGLILFERNAAKIRDLSAVQAEHFNLVSPGRVKDIGFFLFVHDPKSDDAIDIASLRGFEKAVNANRLGSSR